MNDFSKKYLDLITGEYAGINLTRITDHDEFYAKQILDSIEPLKVSDVLSSEIEKKGLVIDVGFGGGFPILPLANVLRGTNFIGVETRGKKCKVVNEIALKLGLENTSFLHSRIENVFIDTDAVITFKAVGKVYDFLSKINTNADISVFFYKGPGFYDLEDMQLKKALNDWKIIEEKEVNIPNTEKRLIIGFKPKKVPRGTQKNSKQLVKVSSII
jgi:16S rRNA (guanine527-N7)-methyltransferase